MTVFRSKILFFVIRLANRICWCSSLLLIIFASNFIAKIFKMQFYLTLRTKPKQTRTNTDGSKVCTYESIIYKSSSSSSFEVRISCHWHYPLNCSLFGFFTSTPRHYLQKIAHCKTKNTASLYIAMSPIYTDYYTNYRRLVTYYQVKFLWLYTNYYILNILYTKYIWILNIPLYL